MIKDRKVSIIAHSVIGAILIALLAVASVYDLQISHSLSNGDSFFGALFVSFGEIPAYIICPIAGTILYYGNSGSRRQIIIYRILSVAIIFLGFLIWCMMGSRHTEPPFLLGMSIIYSVLFTGLCIWMGNLIGGDKLSRYTRWAIFAIMVLVVSLIVIRLMKLAWGRMRYRDMLAINDFAGYTPWYLPQGIRSGDMTSFPSGHTAHACNIFVFCMLVDYSDRFRKFRYYIYGGGMLFVMLTAMSRIIYNAHFLSDVIIGGTVSYICYYLLKYNMFKRGKYLSINSNINKEIVERS